MNKQIRFIPALAVTIVMLSIPIMAIAQEDIDSIHVAGASLAYDGAGANVTVDFTCSPADGANPQVSISLSLTQRNGDMVAFGNNLTSLTPIDCTAVNTDDGRHTQRFEFLVTSQLKIFSKGLAVVQAWATLGSPPSPENPGGLSEFIPPVTQEIQFDRKKER